MLRFVLLATGVGAALGAGCTDAPAALDAFPPDAPPPGTVVVGLTADGVGRARLTVDDQPNFSLGNGVLGLRARLSADGGVTFFDTLPREKIAMGHTIVVDGLDAGAVVHVSFVAVTNLGVASPAGGLLQIIVPSDHTDVDAPAAVANLTALPGAGGVALRWSEPAGDVFRYDVLRGCDGDAPARVGSVDSSATPGFFDSGAHGACVWRVVAEDLSGNRSADSTDATLEVL